MRTIKFRGKSSYERRWIIGALVPNGKRPCIAEFGKLFELTEVDYKSIGQFTGILDKNGKEIYEGDILRLGNSNSGVCEVKWNDNVGAFCIRFYFEHEVGIRPLGMWQECERDIVVIGNNYDNSELLTTFNS